MQEIDDARRLIKDLETKFNDIDALIKEKRRELEELQQKQNDEINNKYQLEEVLEQCSAKNVCQYKIIFEQIKNKKYTGIGKNIGAQHFHFFLSYQIKYDRYDKDVIKSHEEIIKKKGFCWFAKFFKERKDNDSYEELEPFGESIKIDDKNIVPGYIRKNVSQRIADNEPVYLFIYNPNPPDIKLHVANVTEFYYCCNNELVPYQYVYESDPPRCAYVPGYYFYKKHGDCSKCKKFDRDKCKFRFESNFWFKIDKIKKIDTIQDEFVNLVNCYTNDSINLAIPILYPLPVTQKKENFYFGELKKPIKHSKGLRVEIPQKEEAHTKGEKLRTWLYHLNDLCGNFFVRVELIGCCTPYSSKPELVEGGANDEIFLFLPEEFRRDGKAIKVKICLDKKATENEKKGAMQLVANALNGK